MKSRQTNQMCHALPNNLVTKTIFSLIYEKTDAKQVNLSLILDSTLA